ncbi:MAG: hypothetical protein AAF497_24110, partial [Planctomycetota bacterium]
ELGDLLLPAGDDTPKSLSQRRAMLRRQTVDRGRVWRGVRPAAGQNSITLDLSAAGDEGCFKAGGDEDEYIEPIADPAIEGEGAEGEGGAAPAPAAAEVAHGISPGMVVFGFIETAVGNLNDVQRSALLGNSELAAQDQRKLCRVPVFYLGDFRVTAVNGNSVVVEPVQPPSQAQINAFQAQQTWSIYEIMPIDRHDVLEGLSVEQVASLFPQGFNPATIQAMARDLKDANDSDDPTRKRVRVKFLRDYELAVDVDGDEPGIDRNFDPSGRAILAQLRQGEPTKFKSGDEPQVYFDFETANELRRDGTVEFSDEPQKYVRPLRDFNYYFYQKNKQIRSLTEELAIFQEDNASIAESADKIRAQIAYREAEIQKLEKDLKESKTENSVLAGFDSELAKKVKEQRARLGSLYYWNIQQADQLRGGIFMGAGR